jgi:hypothetical protein
LRFLVNALQEAQERRNAAAKGDLTAAQAPDVGKDSR